MENLSSMFGGVARGDFSVKNQSAKALGKPKRIVFEDKRPQQGPSVSEVGPLQGPNYDRSYPIQGYHSTTAELTPGDPVLSSNELGYNKDSKTYNELGHGNFAFFSSETALDYGWNTYRVRAIGEVSRDHTAPGAWKAPRLEVINKIQFGEDTPPTLDSYDPEQPPTQKQKWED